MSHIRLPNFLEEDLGGPLVVRRGFRDNDRISKRCGANQYCSLNLAEQAERSAPYFSPIGTIGSNVMVERTEASGGFAAPLNASLDWAETLP